MRSELFEQRNIPRIFGDENKKWEGQEIYNWPSVNTLHNIDIM